MTLQKQSSVNSENNLTRHYFLLLRQQQGMALLGVFLAAVTAYAGVALLAVSGWFISAAGLAGLSALAAHQFDFFTPGALVRGLSIARTAGRYGERLSSHEATFRVISHLRADLFRKISRQHWSETRLDRHESSSRLMQDIQSIESLYLSALMPLVVTLATTAGYLFTLWLILPSALLLALPLLLLSLGLMPWLYSHQVMTTQDQLQSQRANQWKQSSTLFSCLRTLTLHQRLDQSGDQLSTQSYEADQLESNSVNRQQFWLLMSDLLLIALTVLVFWRGFEAWQQGQLPPANLFMVLLLSMGTREVLLTASPALAAWHLGIRALKRLQGASENSGEQTDDKRQFPDRSLALSVQLRNLSYRYPVQGSTPIFELFNHAFQGPGWYWITGPSGRGKSTLINLIGGQISAQSGDIICSGVQPGDIRLMPQRIDILKATLRDNLSLNRSVTDEDIISALELVELANWARALPQGLDTWLGDGEWQPSGGEIKRIGLARLVLLNPNIILLDEPAAGMDSELAQRLFTRLASHWADRLVIANTHDLSLIHRDQNQLEL